MAIELVGSPVVTQIPGSTTTPQINLPAGLQPGHVVEIALNANGNCLISNYPTGVQSVKRWASFDDDRDGTYEQDGDPVTWVFLYTVPASPPSSIQVTTEPAVGTGAVITCVTAQAFSGVHLTDGSMEFARARHETQVTGTEPDNTPDPLAPRAPDLTTLLDGAFITRGACLRGTIDITPPAGAIASAGNPATLSPSTRVAYMGLKQPAGAIGTASFAYTGAAIFGHTWSHALRPAAGAPPAGPSGWRLGALSMGD